MSDAETLAPWNRVLISRHPQRPHAIDYIRAIADDFIELFGDRTYADDAAIIAGLGRIGGQKFVIIGEEKGHDTETRLKRNFGMPHPEGYRKALRLMELAEKFGLPVLTLLDTAGAYPGLSAEERGQGWAIAENLMKMARLATPIIVLVIGEGCSGGALAIGVGDVIGMLEHSYYTVISPEGCASILWKDVAKKGEAAALLKVQAENLLELGVIDEVIEEGPEGAHENRSKVFEAVKQFVCSHYERLRELPLGTLIENRYQKFRKMGKFGSDETPPSGRS
jgi:acetyl-CoA carboxylase carboxyl transferase subunit alpha